MVSVLRADLGESSRSLEVTEGGGKQAKGERWKEADSARERRSAAAWTNANTSVSYTQARFSRVLARRVRVRARTASHPYARARVNDC